MPDYRIAFGTDTETLEDPDQLVLATMPEEAADLDLDDLVNYIGTSDEVTYQDLVPLEDTLDAVRLAALSEGLNPSAADLIVSTVRDALANNYYA